MDFYFKRGQHKIDPKHPESTDPSYQRAFETGQMKLRRGDLKFESQGAERDYYKAVHGNPGNVPGLPAFFPPTQIREFFSTFTEEESADVKIDRYLWSKERQSPLYCRVCQTVTMHNIVPLPLRTRCSECGISPPYYFGGTSKTDRQLPKKGRINNAIT